MAASKEQQEMIKKLQAEREKLQTLTKEYQKHISTRQQFDAQLNENNLVLSEFNRLKPSAEVYKLVGPVLVKQELNEAVGTVKKRIGFIKGELERCDKNISASEDKQNQCKDSLAKIQQQYQQKLQSAAAK